MWCIVYAIMFAFAKPATPVIVWRNPLLPLWTCRTGYRTEHKGKMYKVLERGCKGEWVVVTVLTVIDGQPKAAA